MGDGKFPKEKFAGALRKWCVENLAILAVGTIEADVNIAAPIPFALAVVVEGELGRPAVIGAPSGVAALEREIGAAIVAHDEDDVGLKLSAEFGELAEINAAGPIARDAERGARRPLAIAEAFGSDGWIRLCDATQFAERMDFARTGAAVITHAKKIEGEVRGGIGADRESDCFTRANAVVRAITFDPWAAIFGDEIDACVGEEPIGGAGKNIFAGDEI